MLFSPSDRWLVSIQCEMVVQIVFVCHLSYVVSIADSGEIHRGPVDILLLFNAVSTIDLPPF